MARKFLFFGPYITGPGAQDLRARLVDAHKAALRKHFDSGALKFGGPFYTDGGAGEDAAGRAFGGTFILMEMESHAAALELIEADIYYKEGLWDKPNLRLVEYSPLTPYPF
ncbi:hypothetical protein DFH07DRAFT_822586 [Mycena maculata]|uniref:YCII-related domain-containing protein n=1 Tax=Mycena maculata TaxID=230809 RepID=A0AAD7J5M5_9AGAR|nr:hypothetical protein DFH07DRAFT_822586 [Mycena maculata]